MSFVEVIGFIISFLALLYLFFQQQAAVRKRQENPNDFTNEEEEEDPLNEWMKEIEREAAAREAARHSPPPPPRVIQRPLTSKSSKPSKKAPLSSNLENYQTPSQIEQRKLKSSLENYRLKSALSQKLEERQLHTMGLPHHNGEGSIRRSRVEIATRRLSRRRDLIIYQEIMDKPKSLRPL